MCWESYKNCDWQVMILDNAVLPKGIQNRHMGYALKGYSLTSWGISNSVDIQNLNNFEKSLLYNDLDIGWYFSLKCKGGEKKLSDETNSSGCSDNVLAEHIPCQFIHTCTEIQCCIPVPVLQRSFYFSLNLDVCNYNLTVYIENLVYHQMLYDYEWGTEDSFWLKGLFRIRFKIYNLRHAMKVRMTLYIDICLEGTPNCAISYLILNHTDLLKAVCSWKQSYLRSESRTQDLKQMLVMIKDGPLADYQVYKLLEESNIGYHLSKDECKIPQTMYKWNNACPHYLQLGVLDGPIFCWISTECTSIICCVHDDVTQHNYQMNLHISPCDRHLELGIEQYRFNQSLLDFNYGYTYAVHLGGIFKISVVIDDLVKTESFIVNMNISICWSYNEECDYSVKILDDLELPKFSCDMARDYQTKGI
ncbi:uncharacterized protein LOC127706621 [Mytilus californianus]|uniref:uncharacterized protein LOC127706621 n=1 Tax=Mytilus californianus TaxID=6549 RepID=UPI00224577FB|nr:uncharacterized protein LOC127706621 [Mytilus californianus]